MFPTHPRVLSMYELFFPLATQGFQLVEAMETTACQVLVALVIICDKLMSVNGHVGSATAVFLKLF